MTARRVTLKPTDPLDEVRGKLATAAVASRPKRNRKSAKAAGTRFERDVADYLAEHIDDRIDRRVKTGSKDRGDLSGWRFSGRRIVAELKNVSRLNLAGWVTEAELERTNDDAHVGLVIHKRHGVGDVGAQYVTLTLADLVVLLTGERP